MRHGSTVVNPGEAAVFFQRADLGKGEPRTDGVDDSQLMSDLSADATHQSGHGFHVRPLDDDLNLRLTGLRR